MSPSWRGQPIERFINWRSVFDTLVFELPSVQTNMTLEGACSLWAFSYSNYQVVLSRTSVGRYCSIGQQVMIGPGSHNVDYVSTHPFASDAVGASCGQVGIPEYEAMAATICTSFGRLRGPYVVLGHDVWVGARAIVLGGVTIGHGAVIAAGAVVTRDVAPYTVVGGVPARPLRQRFSDTVVRRMLACAWWDYDLSALGPIRDYTDVEKFLDTMEGGIEAGTIPKATFDRAIARHGKFRFLEPHEDAEQARTEPHEGDARWLDMAA